MRNKMSQKYNDSFEKTKNLNTRLYYTTLEKNNKHIDINSLIK